MGSNHVSSQKYAGGSNSFHSHRNTPESLAAYDYASKLMRAKMKDKPKLADTLVPTTFPVGCKRPTPGNGYLEALMQGNVHVYQNEGLAQISPKGFIDSSGSEVEVDVIILATGFDTSVGLRCQETWFKADGGI